MKDDALVENIVVDYTVDMAHQPHNESPPPSNNENMEELVENSLQTHGVQQVCDSQPI